MGRRGLKKWGHRSHINGIKRFLSSEMGKEQMELIVLKLKKLQKKLKRRQNKGGD